MTAERNRRCFATGCQRTVSPALLMCPRHWRLVPKAIQKRVWASYQEGQERSNGPTPKPEYWAAVKAAREAVETVERRQELSFEAL